MPITSSQFINPLELSTLDGIIGITFNGIAEYDQNGYSMARAGDVNGDGIDDIVIGAPGSSSAAGSTYLIFGHAGAWDSSFSLGSLNGTNGVVINGITANGNTGYSVAGAQDVNGDGIDDIVIGAPYTSSLTGSAYLIFGRRGAWGSPFVLSSLNGANGVIINGIPGTQATGWSVAGAGDVNKDGFNDLVIGAPYASRQNITNAGSTYLIFGRTGTWSSPLELGSLNGTNGVVINGIATGDFSGCSVASAGDLNKDGIDDFVIGAYQALSQAGSTYLIFGHTGNWSSPLALSSINGINGVIMNGNTADFSGTSVASAGDVNGDGIDDVVIGAYFAAPNRTLLAGSTYLVFGHTGTWSSPLALSELNGTNGVIINGVVTRGFSGYSVASAGDMNEDGIDDVMIGAYGASPGGLTSIGSTYLIFGHAGIWSSPLMLSSLNGTNGVVINGVAAGDFSGISVASAGDVNGDGLSDMLIGAPRASLGGFIWAGSTYLIFGDSLELLTNTLSISQSETIFLNKSMLAAVHPHNLAINASIPFRISNATHGTFSTLNFLQGTLDASSISFTHDKSTYAPSFEMAVGNWAIISPVAALISFDIPPLLYVNSFSVGQGQTVVLTNQTIRATSVYYLADVLIFSVSNVLHGNFVKSNTTVIENQFNQSVLALGQIAFATDGSASAPSYDITVSDGRITTPAIHGTVNFKAAPVLLNNRLILTSEQPKVILSSSDLSANDTAIPAGELIFTPATFNCHFENISLPGAVLPLFLQKEVQGSQILFVWDGYTTPLYNMSVSDGILSTGRPASITIAQASNITSTLTTETTNTGAIIGGVAAASAIGLTLFGLQWYLRKRTNHQLQKILLEGIPDAEEAFNNDVVRPIANKIFDVINTTGCFGQRGEADTKAYMAAIGKIISELRRQNANLDFNAMEPIDKESFINEIANQTRQQSLPKHQGFFGSCARYFKAEATPQEIEYAAESIALASSAWQRRHLSSTSAKNTSLGIELETLNDLGFSNEAANEGVPSEKQFRWMQHHARTMEQREQAHQQEMKWMEEQVAKQEAELAVFRRQGAVVL